MLLLKKKKSKLPEHFLGPVYERNYREFVKTDKRRALPYLRRAALLLFPLKPELWDEYVKLKKEILHKKRSRKDVLSDLKNEMEGL